MIRCSGNRIAGWRIGRPVHDSPQLAPSFAKATEGKPGSRLLVPGSLFLWGQRPARRSVP